MTHRLLRVLAVLAAAGCSAQITSTDVRVRQLAEHWRWKQYWEGTTELEALYNPGRQFQALFFWRTDGMPPSLGFCSVDLGICQFYPDLSVIEDSFQMKVLPGDGLRAAFQRFVADSFGQKAGLVGPPPKPNEADYTVEPVRVTLPALDPPEAIRDRKRPPQAEVDALVAGLGCLSDQPTCKVRLLIPFYSHGDPSVPVFRECSGCPNPKPMIIFMKLVDGNWWHGAMDFNDSPDIVDRTRKQIEKALMLEVNR